MISPFNEKYALLGKLNKEFEDVYIKAAAHYNLSDSIFWILYVLYENRDGYTQKEICDGWYFSKQTINTSIKKLLKDDYISLKYKDNNSKSKLVYLTPKGLELAKSTVANVIEAENTAFSKIGEKGIDQMIKLFQHQLSLIKEEINKIL